MELRWILILAGLAIFGFLYYSGRPKRSANAGSANSASSVPAPEPPGNHPNHPDPYAEPGHYRDYPAAMDEYEGSAGQSNYPQGSPDMSGQGHAYADHPAMQHDHYHPGPASDETGHEYGQTVADPLMETAALDNPATGAFNPDGYAPEQRTQAPSAYTDAMQIDPGDMQRPADAGWSNQPPAHSPHQAAPGYTDQYESVYPDSMYPNDGMNPVSGEPLPPAVEQRTAATKSSGGLTGLLAQLSGGLLGRQKKRGRNDPNTEALYASGGIDPLVITLHVVAPDGQIIHGPRLQELFEQRGYQYGQMNIYHSLNQGSIVFSIAKMIEPGTFDVNVPASFETPGVTMILQLPAPVAADVAFEVFVSEARELATALGCTIVDSDFSSLSQQTVQHLRDSVHQFMHKQRLAETVTS